MNINEIRPGNQVQGCYLVRRKARGVGKTGKPWLQVILGDKTGTVDGRIWDDAERYDRELSINDVVKVEGQAVRFMDRTQLKIIAAQVIDAAETDPLDYMPEGERSPRERREALLSEIEGLDHPWLRRLMEAYIGDAEWMRRFMRASAARSVHHAYIGGLSEHTLSMMRMARLLGEHYRGLGVRPLDVDLLVVGAFLHDTGKIDEISVEGGFEYTDPGRLLGHLILGMQELDRRVAGIEGFPPQLHLHLRHLVLSHHGEYEFGSPRRPKTVEALLLHHIDNLDARVEIFRQAIDNAGDGDGPWTGYESVMGRFIYRQPLSGRDVDDTGDGE